jgi:hypothetical protein
MGLEWGEIGSKDMGTAYRLGASMRMGAEIPRYNLEALDER